MNLAHVFRNHRVLIYIALSLSSIAAGADNETAATTASAASLTAAKQSEFIANNIWMLLSTFLVFIMHLGFASLEAGLTQAKNTVNILFKNTAIIAIGLITYAAFGFNLMYPGFAEGSAGILAFAGFGIAAPAGAAGLIDYAGGAYTYHTDFIFQAMFAATAATIVSGAVAERIKLNAFIIFSAIFVGIVYPFLGSWKWGGGWLDAKGFYDFAGSTLVHSVGGWGALACVLILGPRVGKYTNGKSNGIPGHSIPLATIGVFLLWLGWFGFNGGSVLSADPQNISFVIVTTTLAAAAGIVGSMIATSTLQSKPDLTMVLNGSLAGLVGITAGADTVTIMSSLVIGFIAGMLVVASVIFIDAKLKLDDPVGAISVHLVCGIWGTLAVGIFSTNPEHHFMTQLLGVTAYGAVAFPSALVIFYALKKIIGVRVSEKEERVGLDISEHRMEAYSGFQIFSNQ